MSSCRAHVAPRELECLEQGNVPASEYPIDDNVSAMKELRYWQRWDLSLRSDLAVLRAQALGWEIEPYQETPRELKTFEVAREAMVQSSPYEAEEILDRARWEFLDQLEVGHYFDIEKLLVYLLKIRILERRARFTDNKGTESFEKTYNRIAADLGEALEIEQ